MRTEMPARPLLVCLLHLSGCAAQTAAAPATSSPLHADAPRWAQAGDRSADDGHAFVCEGRGDTEAEAQATALSLCSAKICNLCGVEVEAVVETAESLTTVEVQRRVVERCRRVKRGEDEVRYSQSACGPEGCLGWVEVFFSKEAEARECKAYQAEDFADPAQCEALVEQFRQVQGLTAEAFDQRGLLLTRAIVACAEIDVRPTPRLQALDEILYQGVVTPELLPSTAPRLSRQAPLPEQLQQQLAARRDEARRELAKASYKPMPRQPLVETKIFVDRIARVRDEMTHYARLMRVWERATEVAWSSDEALPALFEAMAALRSFAQIDARAVNFRALDIISFYCQRHAELTGWLRERYRAAELDDSLLEKAAEIFAADEQISAAEWDYLLAGRFTRRAMRIAFNAEDHGGEPIRVARFLAGVAALYVNDRSPNRVSHISGLLSTLSPLEVERVAAALPSEHREIITRYAIEQAIHRLPPGETSRTTPVFAALLARMWEMTRGRSWGEAGASCNDLQRELNYLDERGIDTREMMSVVCACLESGDRRRVNDLSELYVRALAWKAPCVTRGGTK